MQVAPVNTSTATTFATELDAHEECDTARTPMASGTAEDRLNKAVDERREVDIVDQVHRPW